jgi:hypothetical protein
MGASEHRFGAAGLVVGLALCAASGCGGAVTTFLDQPASGKGDNGGDDTSTGSHEASGSSSGGPQDATLTDETNPGDDQRSDAAGDSGGDDVGTSPDDAGPDSSGMCGPCAPGNRCCTVPGTISFRQCYSVLCGACCF